VLALAAQRNLPMLGVVAAAVVGRGLRVAAAGDDDRRPPLHLGIAVLLGGLAVLFVAVAATEPALEEDGYPVRAARLIAAHPRHPTPDERPARVVTTDIAAGYLILREGRDANVFIDDRVDLHPVRAIEDYLHLLDGRPGALRVLDRYDADVVLWETDRALSAQLAASERWRRVGVRDGWAVWVRATTPGG
jgi:hypothetical protein